MRQISGQAMTEYLLVFALVVLVAVAALVAWQQPIAHYLDRIAQVLVKTR
jgi:hypothetical protein